MDKIYENYELLERKKIFEKIREIIEGTYESQNNSCQKIKNRSPVKRDKKKSILNHKQAKSCM